MTSYLQKLRRRWKAALAVFLLTVGSTTAATELLKEKYQAEGKILFNPKLSDIDSKEVASAKDFLGNQTPLITQQQIISSAPVIQKTIETLSLKDGQGNFLTTDDFKQKLKVSPIENSNVLRITYQDQDPIKASQIVNTLIDVYLEEQLRTSQAESVNADSFVTRQIPQVAEKLQQYESILQEFRTKHSIVDLEEEKKILVTELGTLNRQISQTGSQLEGTKAQTATLQKQLGLNFNQAIAVSQLGNSPTTQSVLTELGNTEIAIAKERQRFKDTHPSVASLLEKKANLRSSLEQQIAQAVGKGVKVSDGLLKSDSSQQNPLTKFIDLTIAELSLQQQLKSHNQYQQVYLKRAEQLPKLEKKEREINQQVATARQTYENLVKTQQELQLIWHTTTSNVEVIEQANASEQSGSLRLALILGGVVLGLLLSNLTVVGLEMQDRTIKTVADLKQKLPYKVLGIIPLQKTEKQEVIVKEEPDSYSSEIYRMIHASLKFMTAQNQPQVIVVTSSVPGEGKSTVTANLAAAIAQLGHRVLLIDGDLRKASQHQLWKTDNHTGLKNVLANGASLNETVVQPIRQLDLLTSGIIPPNPLTLLDSPEMIHLIAKARQQYDIVLIDAPPLPVMADVLTMSKLADGVIFVSRLGVVEKESAEFATETLESSDQKVLGMVINGVDSKEFDRYSYSAKYGKSYFSTAKT